MKPRNVLKMYESCPVFPAGKSELDTVASVA